MTTVSTTERKPWRRLFELAATLFPLAFVAYTTLIAPRPYYVTQMDSEQDYYYNAQLLHHGLPETVHHPGTPVHHVSQVLLAISGDDLANTQRFLDLAYWLAALLAGLGIFAFCRLVLRDQPIGVGALAVAAAVVWPPFLTYLDYFGADSFIIAIGLPVAGVFWASLQSVGRPLRRAMIVAGIGTGLAMAIKMSFLPLAVAIFVGFVLRELRLSGRAWSWRSLLLYPLTTLASFLVWTAPVITRLPTIWQRTVNRPDTGVGGGTLYSMMRTFRGILAADPLFGLLLLVVTALALVAFIAALRQAGNRAAPTSPTGVGFDFVAAGAFLAVLALALVYTSAAAAQISPGADAGVRFRNMSPTVVMLPFAILYCARWAATRGLDLSRGPAPAALTLTAVALVCFGVTRDLGGRKRLIADHMERIVTTERWVESLAHPPARLAFWTESNQDYLGEASFHFWGNYRYGNQAFDQMVLARFPAFTFAQLRNVHHDLEKTSTESTPPAQSRFGKLGTWYWNLRHQIFRDREHYNTIGGLLTGGAEHLSVSAIAIPRAELTEVAPMTVPELESLLAKQFGLVQRESRKVGGVEWVVYQPAGQSDHASSR